MNMPMMALLVIMVIVMHGVDWNDRVAVAGCYEGRGAGAWTSSSFLFCTACMRGKGNQILDHVNEDDD